MLPQKIDQTPSVEKLLGQLKPILEKSGFKSLNDIVLKGVARIVTGNRSRFQDMSRYM